MKLLLIEGVPGSGKSTTADAIYEICRVQGIDAKWYREEFVDHPIHPKTFKRARREADFPARCLDKWREFVTDANQRRTLTILEGSAFQSTVRYMVEQDYEPEFILDYFKSFEDSISVLQPVLIYLRQRDFDRFYAETLRTRDRTFAEKVPAYLSGTAFCKRRGFVGAEGMKQFWRAYRDFCDGLTAQARMPVKTIDNSSRTWQLHLGEVLRFVQAHGVSIQIPSQLNVTPGYYCQPDFQV